jgi:hypothetical protein
MVRHVTFTQLTKADVTAREVRSRIPDSRKPPGTTITTTIMHQASHVTSKESHMTREESHMTSEERAAKESPDRRGSVSGVVVVGERGEKKEGEKKVAMVKAERRTKAQGLATSVKVAVRMGCLQVSYLFS